MPLIVDVDTGIDDALALLLAIASPELDVMAVTCVSGNVPAKQVGENTRAVLELRSVLRLNPPHSAVRRRTANR